MTRRNLTPWPPLYIVEQTTACGLDGDVVDGSKRGGDQLVEPQGCPSGRGPRLYSVFSLGPIIVIAIAVAGLFFGHEAVTSQVISSLQGMLGDTGAKAIESMLAKASRPAEGALATILGIGALLFAAIGVVVPLKDALNVVWEVQESEESGLGISPAATCCRSPPSWRRAFFSSSRSW
jgi:hypothetical protein